MRGKNQCQIAVNLGKYPVFFVIRGNTRFYAVGIVVIHYFLKSTKRTNPKRDALTTFNEHRLREYETSKTGIWWSSQLIKSQTLLTCSQK